MKTAFAGRFRTQEAAASGRRLRVLLYGINFAPELTGIGKYTGEMAEWLAAQGHEVRVVTAPPYYPQWSVDPHYDGRRYTRETWRGVEVLRCPLWVPRHPSGLKRLLHLASFALSSLPQMLRQATWRPHVVWAVEPSLMCAPAAVLTARLAGARSWLHAQDFEVDAAFELGLLRGRLKRRMVEAVERWLMRRFDMVSTISDRMMDRLEHKGVPLANRALFPNWVDVAAMRQGRHDVDYRALLDIPRDAVVAMYSGNMGDKQGLELLSEVAALSADDPNLMYVFCGDGAGRKRLQEACEHLPNVRFLRLQPAEHLPALLATADIHLLPQRAEAADLVMPSKLCGMLASGRSVVATAAAGSAVARVVECCGLVTPPGDARALYRAIAQLAESADVRRELGRAARRYAEDYLDRESVLTRFERRLQNLVRGRGRGATAPVPVRMAERISQLDDQVPHAAQARAFRASVLPGATMPAELELAAPVSRVAAGGDRG